MNIIWLCITSVLSFSVIAGQHVDESDTKVFPKMGQSIAGVFQVTFVNKFGESFYALNATEARTLCLSLGVEMASKEQVQVALSRGLETCRFGWIDEHLAVIPRINPQPTCGRSQTGLVTWRSNLHKKFDVFCFNESDSATQFQDTTSTSPTTSSSRDQTEQTHSTQTTHSTSSSSPHPSSASSAPQTRDSEAEAAHYVGDARRSAGGKVVLITSCCALLLTVIIIIVYFKMRKLRSHSADVKQQQQQDEEYIETEDWTCARPQMEQTVEEASDEEKVEMEDEDKDVSIELSQSDVTE